VIDDLRQYIRGLINQKQDVARIVRKLSEDPTVVYDIVSKKKIELVELSDEAKGRRSTLQLRNYLKQPVSSSTHDYPLKIMVAKYKPPNLEDNHDLWDDGFDSPSESSSRPKALATTAKKRAGRVRNQLRPPQRGSQEHENQLQAPRFLTSTGHIIPLELQELLGNLH
jgi:hypothetical protein